jgi:hypothetical protein
VWNGDPNFANITGPTTYEKVSTTFLASSPNGRFALALVIESSSKLSTLFYLH